MTSAARLLPALLLLASPVLAAAPPPGPGTAYRSSLAAVLAQRGAVQLTPEQVRQFEQAEARLQRDQEAARAEAAQAEEAPAASPAAGKPSAPKGGGGGPGGMSGGKTRPPPNIKASGPSAADLLQQRLDALDTEALLHAVESLPEAQRERAIEVASRYREQLFEQREREKSR